MASEWQQSRTLRDTDEGGKKDDMKQMKTMTAIVQNGESFVIMPMVRVLCETAIVCHRFDLSLL